ncbi:21862_t:CDS:2 [Gigaspora margarita]|uniref:21862_t:CDS:1 n=1 Tax=Gigaspora margarita TaxID=4874 RepID=A0ABN7V4I6_GIGMA|nr:21862_t:CDS:2 [Gigaspora margarita]
MYSNKNAKYHSIGINSAKNTTNKKIWDVRDRIASLKVESELIKLESEIDKANNLKYFCGFQVYADTEVDSAGQERKRLRTNENDKVAIKGASPIITSNIRDPTQSEPNKQRTLENQEEPSSRMVLRKQKKGFYDK